MVFIQVALRTTDHDDGWTMVDRDSEGNSEASSSEEEDNVSDCGLERVRLDRTSSLDSLTHVNVMDMEESWFVTPPPCFSSQTGYYFFKFLFLHLWRLWKTGPVHLRTSPLENLLIEHPSMSVYQRTGSRHPLLRSPTPSVGHVDDADTEVLMDSSVLGADVEPVVIYRLSRNNSSQRVTSVAQLKEMQMVRHRQAQKVSVLTWTKLDIVSRWK